MKGRFLFCAMVFFAAVGRIHSQEIPKEYQTVLSYLDRKGDYKDNVFKVNIPRNDLHVTVAGISTPTPFGFGGWLAMTKGDRGKEVMMGDLVLRQEEVNPVMSALLENGLEVTALHNHFFWDEPRLFYMHVHGYGSADDLAHRVKPALDLISHVVTDDHQSEQNAPSVSIGTGKLDAGSLEKIIGHSGENLGPVFKITVGRPDIDLREMGAKISTRMGLNTWAAFIGDDARSAVAGDVAMLEHEVVPVLKALRHHGLDVVAIHHHMTGARPMVIFLHYWGVGSAQSLARGVRAALDELGKGMGKM